MSKEITINGQHFASRTAAAKHFGLSSRTLHNRLLKYGPDDPRVIAKPYSTPHAIQFLGQQFTSLYAAAQHYHMNYWTFLRRLKRYGYNDPRVIRPTHIGKYFNIIILGKHYDTLQDAADDLGVRLERLRYHIKKYGPDDSRILAADQQAGRPVTIQGQYFPSKAAAARHFGLNERTLAKRLTKFGPDDPRVLTKPQARVFHDYSHLIVDGHEFHSLTEAANYYHLPVLLVISRIEQEHADPSDHDTYRPKGSRHRGRVITYRGQQYDSVTQLCEQRGLKRYRVYDLLRHGGDIDQLEPTK